MGWGRVACWSTKAAISLKSCYGGPQQRCFKRYHPDHLGYGLLFPKIGVRNPNPKLQSLLSQEGVKLRTSNLAGAFKSIRTKAIKDFGEKGAWAYLGTAEILGVTTIISGTDKATNFKFCTHIHRFDRNKSPLKFREIQRWT